MMSQRDVISHAAITRLFDSPKEVKFPKPKVHDISHKILKAVIKHVNRK